MRLKIIILLGFLIAAGCRNKTPDEILIDEFEAYFKTTVIPNLDDPNSYEKVSTQIIDTIFLIDYWRDLENTYSERLFYHKNTYESSKRLYETALNNNKEFAKYRSKEENEYNNERVNEYLEDLKEYEDAVNETQGQIDSLSSLIGNSSNANDIFSIILLHTLRAKNKFGALVKETIEFNFYPNQTDNAKRFIIKSN
jgi:hypothetical protein